MSQGDDTPTRQAFHNAGQEIADRAEPQPTRPDEVRAPSPGWTLEQSMTDQFASAHKYNQWVNKEYFDKENAKQQIAGDARDHAGAPATDKQQSPKEKEMEAFRLKMEEAFKKDDPSHEHTIKR